MNQDSISISLVLATLGRTEPIHRLLDSIQQQSVNLEVLIVDQNEDDRIPRLLSGRHDPWPVQVIRASPGVSHARNVGANAARGNIIGFPDDDCWYPPGLLQRIEEWFNRHRDAHGLSCRVTDERGRGSAGGFMSKRAHWISRGNVWRSATSPGIFIRRDVHRIARGFDERLGVGTKTRWGSAEETDYVLKAISGGCRLYYDPAFVVLHPRKIEPLSRETLRRAWRYGEGVGFVLRKHDFGFLRAIYYAKLPIGSACVALVRGDTGRAAARLCMAAGRFSGWCRARRDTAEEGAAADAPITLPSSHITR